MLRMSLEDQLRELAKKMGGVSILPKQDVSYLDQLFLDSKTRLLTVPSAKLYSVIPADHLRLWCHHHGFYGLPTIELVNWLREQIAGRSAIEIGSGNGALGRALGIPITDSRLQERADIKAHYESIGQPTIKYPDDIQAFEALEAIRHFKPQVVIASWVTQVYREETHELGGNQYGIDEDVLLQQVPLYIHIGNIKTHSGKRILKLPHETYSFPWLYGRGEKSQDVIYVWRQSN